MKNLARLAIVSWAFSGPLAFAADNIITKEVLEGTVIAITVSGDYYNTTLLVTGPNKFALEGFSRSNQVLVDLKKSEGFDDGLYRYQVTAASSKETMKSRSTLDNGRGKRENATRPMNGSGTGAFMLKNGVIVKVDKNIKEDG